MKTNDPWDAALYDANHSFVNKMARGLLEILAPQPGERILDLGCGTGALTQQIADAGAMVVGIDASAAMIAQAQKSYPRLDFRVADALTMQFAEPFDAIFSNAALHWIKPPAVAAGRMFAALKPGGRLVLEMGGKGNVSVLLRSAIEAGRSLGLELTPFIDINYFPSIGEYTGVLEQTGFAVTSAMLFDRPTPLSDGAAGLANWIRMFRPAALDAVPKDRLSEFFAAMESKCRPDFFRDGTWHADYRRLRVTAARSRSSS
jgi:trans-aconitate methyltransferase